MRRELESMIKILNIFGSTARCKPNSSSTKSVILVENIESVKNYIAPKLQGDSLKFVTSKTYIGTVASISMSYNLTNTHLIKKVKRNVGFVRMISYKTLYLHVKALLNANKVTQTPDSRIFCWDIRL